MGKIAMIECCNKKHARYIQKQSKYDSKPAYPYGEYGEAAQMDKYKNTKTPTVNSIFLLIIQV
jgi:hypothetical protein